MKSMTLDRWTLLASAVLLLILPFTVSGYVLYVVNLLMVFVVLALGMHVVIGEAGQFALSHAAFYGIGIYTAGLMNSAWHPPFFISILAGGLLSAVLGYLIGFLTIGNAWINHHNLFRLVGRVSHGVLITNLFLLLAVGFMPFPTALLADTLGGPAEQVGVVVYAGAFVITAVFFNVLWFQVKKVLRSDARPGAVEAINRSYRLGPPISAAALVIAFVNPTVGISVIAGLMVLYLLPRSSGT